MDKETIDRLKQLSAELEKYPRGKVSICITKKISIRITDGNFLECHFRASDIHDVIMTHLIEAPVLRRELDRRINEIKELKAQLNSAETSETQPPKWEHKCVSIGSTSVRDDVRDYNLLGAEGWELVTIDNPIGLAYFKRAL